MEHAEVYINIIRAKDIKGVERNGNSDPYIRVMIPGAKGKFQELYRTETIKNTRNPSYNIELVLRVPTDVESIYLQLKDWNEYLKDKKLGVVILPLNKFTKEAHVEDHTIDGGGTLKLCTRFLGTIPGVPQPKLVEVLPKVRIHLEQFIYHPGEVARGYMVFTDEPMVKGEKSTVHLFASCSFGRIQYLDLFQQFDTIRGGSRIYAFQFLVPKKIPTAYKASSPGSLQLSVHPPSHPEKSLNTNLILMPSFEGLEPNLSPRLKEKYAIPPSHLSVTWVDVPKVLYHEQKYKITLKLANSATKSALMKFLDISFGCQAIMTEHTDTGFCSNEYVRKCTIARLERVRLDPTDSKELHFVIDNHRDLPRELSAPFEISEDQECNYFLEVSVEPPNGARFVVDRKPIFWTSELLTRPTPPNYGISMKPNTFQAVTIDDPDAVYALMAPAAIPETSQDRVTLVAEPVPTKEFSKSRRETLKNMLQDEEHPVITNIFDVPFVDRK